MQTFNDNDSIPVSRSGHVASVVAGNMIIWGGFGQVTDSSREKYVPSKVIWSYNLETQKWTRHEVPGLPMVGRSGSGCFSHDGKMYVWGGFPNHSKQVFCLDLCQKTWQTYEIQGKVPEHRDKFVSWQYQGRLIIFGGFGPQPADATSGSWVQDPSSADWHGNFRGWNNEMFEYDLKINRWHQVQTKGPVPFPRASHAGAIIDDRGFIFGGRYMSERRNDMHSFDLRTNTWSGSLSEATSSPNLDFHAEMDFSQVAAWSKQIPGMVKYSANTVVLDLLKLCNYGNLLWKALWSIRLQVQGLSPEGRSWHSLTAIGPHHLLLCGGFNTRCKPLDDMWIFDTENLIWTRLKWDLPTPRLWHTAVQGSHLGEVVIFGGCINNILDSEHMHTNSLLHIEVSAKPLFRICLGVIWQNIDRLKPFVERLPSVLKRQALKASSPR